LAGRDHGTRVRRRAPATPRQVGTPRRRRTGQLLAMRSAHPTRCTVGPRPRRRWPHHLARTRAPGMQPRCQRTPRQPGTRTKTRRSKTRPAPPRRSG